MNEQSVEATLATDDAAADNDDANEDDANDDDEYSLCALFERIRYGPPRYTHRGFGKFEHPSHHPPSSSSSSAQGHTIGATAGIERVN